MTARSHTRERPTLHGAVAQAFSHVEKIAPQHATTPPFVHGLAALSASVSFSHRQPRQRLATHLFRPFPMSATRVPLFYRMTNGIRISARPTWLHEQSQPALGRFVFTYHIRIENSGVQAAQLRTRRWLIHDEGVGDTMVEGEGVVGEQPHLIPGAVHEYTSFCVLTTPRGWMEGSYQFVRDDGSPFDAVIPRFTLEADADTGSAT